MALSICKKVNITLEETSGKIIQLDRIEVQVVGEINDVLKLMMFLLDCHLNQ